MEKSILAILKSKYPALSEKEKKVAAYLLTQPDQVPEMTIGELSIVTGLAPSGIVRLCKNLGFSGFAEVKRNLLKIPFTIIPKIAPSDDVGEMVQKVFESGIRSLEDTLSMMDMSLMRTAADLLYRANSIHFFGVGTSATIAQDAYYRFMRIGFPAHSEVDSHIMQIAAAEMQQGEAAVAISHCGATMDTLDALRTAKEHGAATIAITSAQDSPIAALADVTLVVYSDEVHYPIEAVSARIAHIAVLDALCVILSMRDPERTSLHIRQMNMLFKKKRVQKKWGRL